MPREEDFSTGGYLATFQEEFLNGKLSHPDQIRQSVHYKNASGKKIDAVQIGFATFDAFNGFMDTCAGLSVESIEADAEGHGVWMDKPYAAFKFERFGTGVTFVKAVRFADGTIWRCDMSEVLAEMQKLEKDLKKEDLEEKKATAAKKLK